MRASLIMGRMIFGAFFLYNGINHFLQREKLTRFAGMKKVPMPEAAVTGSGVLLTLSGLGLTLGVKPEWGAAGAAAFLAGVTPAMHDFWRQEGAQRESDLIHFGKNLALLGGALGLVAAAGQTRVEREALLLSPVDAPLVDVEA